MTLNTDLSHFHRIAKLLENVNVKSLSGLYSAIAIFSLWFLSFVIVCQLNISTLPIWGIVMAIAVRTFLHTGLFIVAHDAAHGTVFTPSRRINDGIGRAAIAIYGLLPYEKFVVNHGLHHLHPASSQDPDFHDGKRSGKIEWYVSFMKRYLDRKQNIILLVGMTIIFHTIRIGFHVPAVNLLLFWALPLLLSSMQLFYFGTYLPHRFSQDGYQDHHHTRSNNFPVLISFLTCYHFGYHWEHHQYPNLPWFKLPSAR
jgi:beta-carotene/zeaxanthin 4-ketolase